ncbi:bifunctional riboflavin kinase/FAD synthetase [Polaribacter gangjinensis]|uniref:Riboflavin biosynthesis protein n=1 Tax=Polaribacter gangjinensis TaxID=574710 RepID=A0A2S7WF19_9FLAO|nr:bifunctional riboflavin kinase/FAD synthetase [Polaribacter gangjinensis]PQJ76228.1 riboflavin biosynthesis protein RibF [Polaribacter gangjinensis]
MKTIYNTSNFISDTKTYVTIGTFDGVHFGHQKIIEKLVFEAKKAQKKSVVLTFFPHPRMVLQKDASVKLINTIDERANLLEKTGLDYLIIHPFSVEFSKMTALEFVRDILVNQLNIAKLIIGYDHHFGKNREGNITQLSEYSDVYNFDVEEIPAQDIDEVSVSSTKIRRALESGNLQTANHYLGYPFMLNGTVVNGKKLGGKIGYPTANIAIEEPYKLIPKTGVYVVKSTINENVVFGMMNIGNRPTVDGNYQTIEVHFFDFNEDLYGKKLRIDLLYFLRDEQKFDSISLLVNQLKNDEKNAKNYLKNKL